MRYKPLFRLMLKLLGVYLFADGCLGFVSNLSWWIAEYFAPSGFSNTWSYSISNVAGPILRVGVGCYLFFGGRWIVDRAIPGNRPYCPECGYDLTGAASDRCPECGTPFRIEDLRPRAGNGSDRPSV